MPISGKPEIGGAPKGKLRVFRQMQFNAGRDWCDTLGAALMAIAGIAWGIYTLRGRGAEHPLEATAANFIYCAPLALLASLPFLGDVHGSLPGIALAIGSGAAASAIGYAIWYAALLGLTAMRAATVQLSVPAIAAFAGVVVLSEEITMRLLIASAATLGGIAIVLAQRAAKTRT